MSYFFTLTIRARGSLAVGGVAEVDRAHHGASARDRKGRPYIPATALRGALRSTLEALLRGAAEASQGTFGEDACAGGTGLPVDAAEGARPIPCTRGKGGQRCLACRLFGGQRELLPPDAPFFSALILGDATASPDVTWTTRPTVGIQRSTRAANNQTLAMHEVPAPAPALVFTARGRLLDPDLLSTFENVVRATTHLGAGRSRGLGRVELELHQDTPPSDPPVDITSDAVRLRVKLLTPASFGVPIADDNLRDTRREIPGAALRGAVGFALAEALRGQHSREQPDLAFEQLVAEDGARFSFLYPVDSESQNTDATPLPATALACKFEKSHPLVDGLLDAIVASLVDDPLAAERVARSSRSARCRHPGCGAPLRSRRGPRSHLGPIATRTVTRLAMDRRLSSAKNQMLFTQVLLEPDLVFEGSIHHIPEASRERLALALQQPLNLGRGRASGWGQADVKVLPPTQLAPLHERASAFHRALADRLADAELSRAHAGRWIAVNLLAPLIPDDGDDDGSAALERLLPEAEVRFRARRFVREGGWDQRGRGMEPAWAVAAGGVFALQLRDGVTLRDVLPRLLDLERDGLGQRRHQGYGAVRCFDPFHCGSPT